METNNKYRHLYNSFNQTNYIKNIDIFDYISLNDYSPVVDLSPFFPSIYDQKSFGITSSCAIVSLMSYFLKKYYNIDKVLSPFFLAYQQFQCTQSWHTIDLLTGIEIANTIGLCSNELIDSDFYITNDLNDLNDLKFNNFINIDASQHKLKYYKKIDITIDNIENLLNDTIPILCSFKMIPTTTSTSNQQEFYKNLNNYNYWSDVEDYYNNNDNNIYSVSVVIVGYDNLKKRVKIRGCWGDLVGDNGYFYINYDIIESFYELFFDTYIVDSKSSLSSNSNLIELLNKFNINILYEDDNSHIIKFPSSGQKSPRRKSEMGDDDYTNNELLVSEKKESFKKVSSMTNINCSFINIESLYDLNKSSNCFINNNQL